MRRPEFQLVAWTLNFYLRVDGNASQSSSIAPAKPSPDRTARTRTGEKKR